MAQARSVALLRAINVGGRSVISMADLRAVFEAAGFENVSTYIQTGNVLFSAGAADRAQIARRIEERLAADFGYRTTAFVLSASELRRAAAHNPFDPERLDAVQRCHLMFLSRPPTPARRRALKAMEGEEYRFHVRGRVLYYAYPRAADATRRRGIDFEKVLGVTGTARTWKVVAKLIELTTD